MMDAGEVCRRLLATCERIADSWSLEEGLTALGQATMSLLRPRSVAIVLAGEGDGTLRIIASRGLSAGYLNRHAIPLDDPGVQRVFVGREDVSIGRIEPGKAECETLRLETEHGSLIATPIVAMNRPVGLVIATSDQEACFNEEHMLLLKLAARMAASCHDRCSLYEERRLWMAMDRKTGLWSFEFFCNRMSEEIARSRRQKAPLSLALVDIDGFLRYKQTHGSDAADDLFGRFVEVTRGAVRGIDFMGRFSLDEVLVALPHTDLRGAVKVAERIREAVERSEFPQATPKVTASVGVAALKDGENHPGPMIDRAQRALYGTLTRGGNCVCAEGVA